MSVDGVKEVVSAGVSEVGVTAVTQQGAIVGIDLIVEEET